MIRPVFLLATACLAADTGGEAIYKTRCAMCHDHSSETRAPGPSALRQMSPESVVKSLESGQMKQQGESLTAAQRTAVSEFLTAKTLGQASVERPGMCAAKPAFAPTGAAWNGWSTDLTNARFQPAEQARLSPADVPKLK